MDKSIFDWYWPRGEMCLSCVHLRENCSKLPFSEMRVIGKDSEGFEVKCEGFKRIEEGDK